MQNLNEKNNPDKNSDPTPLGLDEMNSVIKSFQDSSFNTEELYNKNEKVFVKKTLYDLAIELYNDKHFGAVAASKLVSTLSDEVGSLSLRIVLAFFEQLAEKEQLRETISLSESKIAAKEYNLRAMEDDAKIFMQDLQEQHKKLKEAFPRRVHVSSANHPDFKKLWVLRNWAGETKQQDFLVQGGRQIEMALDAGATTVSFHLLWAPCHLNELNGRPEMRHSLPIVPLSMRR